MFVIVLIGVSPLQYAHPLLHKPLDMLAIVLVEIILLQTTTTPPQTLYDT